MMILMKDSPTSRQKGTIVLCPNRFRLGRTSTQRDILVVQAEDNFNRIPFPLSGIRVFRDHDLRTHHHRCTPCLRYLRLKYRGTIPNGSLLIPRERCTVHAFTCHYLPLLAATWCWDLATGWGKPKEPIGWRELKYMYNRRGS